MFLNSLNHFRAVAILFIVAGHCFAVGVDGWRVNSFPEKLVICLTTGGTAFFVFISGFLFYHLFYSNFNFLKFMKKKMAVVLVPYLILSTLTLLYFTLQNETLPYVDYFFSGDGLVNEYIKPYFLYLATGATWYAYWYIPFIMVIFFLSPLFIIFIETRLSYQLIAISILLLISMLMHRPAENINVFQSVLYFSPVYMLGILCAMKRQALYSYLKGKDYYLLGLALIIAGMQIGIYGTYEPFHKEPFEVGLPDLMLLQKVVLCLFFMIWLERYQHIENRIISILASSSFAIYFLHPFIIKFFNELDILSRLHIPGGLQWPIITVAVLVVSVFLAYLIRIIFSRSSRYITGW